MIVITVNNCPLKLRGDLTKWLCEINTGVYVGQVSGKVREMLWARVCENINDGSATMVYNFANEQHFEFRTHNTHWKVRDYDGIKLMMHPYTLNKSDEVLQKGFSTASRHLTALRNKAMKANSAKEWVFLDIETSGLDVHKDKILEIGIIIADETEIKSSWSTMIKQEISISSEISELTAITDEMLGSGISLDDALCQLSDIVKGRKVICYNRGFDITFLERDYRNHNMEIPFSRVSDALNFARKRIIDIENYRLETLAKYFDIPLTQQHRALTDCELLYRVFLKLNGF